MSDTPTKDQVLDAYNKMKDMFLDGIQGELKSHMADKHTFMYGKNKSIWRATEKLNISKELAIFVLMGSNRRMESWGSLKDNFELEPLNHALTPLIVEQCREVSKGFYYRVFFTDRDKLDGNFKLKINMNPLSDKKPQDIESEDNEGFKPVKGRSYKNALKTEAKPLRSVSKPLVSRPQITKSEDKELEILRARVAALESQLKN